MRAMSVGKWDQANKTGPLWGANCVQPSDSHEGNKVKPLLVSLPGFRLAKVRGHVAWMQIPLSLPSQETAQRNFGLWRLIRARCKPIRKSMMWQRHKERETLKWNKRNWDVGRGALKRAKGIQSRTVIERMGKEAERGEDSRIKKGRKCPVMQGWATTGGFPRQTVSSQPPFQWDNSTSSQPKLSKMSHFQAIFHDNQARWQTSPFTFNCSNENTTSTIQTSLTNSGHGVVLQQRESRALLLWGGKKEFDSWKHNKLHRD